MILPVAFGGLYLLVVGATRRTAGFSGWAFGVGFFLWETLPFHTTIWHGFVLVATGLIYAAILLEVLREIDVPLV